MREIPVILNGGSGAGQTAEELERLRAAFREAGLEARFEPFLPGDDPRELARRALKSRPPVIVAAGGEVRWTPPESAGPGTYPVTLAADDGNGGTAQVTFPVTVREVNRPPALTVSSQILASTLFGFLGLALADPIVAMIKVALERKSEQAVEAGLGPDNAAEGEPA